MARTKWTPWHPPWAWAIWESPSLPPEIEELRLLSGRHLCANEPETAEQLLLQALEMGEEELGDESEALVPLLEQIAGLCWEADRNDEARVFANRAIEVRVWSRLGSLEPNFESLEELADTAG